MEKSVIDYLNEEPPPIRIDRWKPFKKSFSRICFRQASSYCRRNFDRGRGFLLDDWKFAAR